MLQLTSSLGFYGAEQMIMTLITALDSESFDVRLAAFEKKRVSSNAIVSTARAAGFDAVTLPCRGWLDWGAIQELKSLVEEQKIEILHCHEPKSRLYGAVVSRMTGIPMVATHHNWTGQNLRTRLVELIDAAVLHSCQRVVAVSGSVAESMRRVLISWSRIEVIPNGIDLSGFKDSQQNNELRASLGIPPGVPVIGAVGRLDIQKAHERLIEAAQKLTDAGQDAIYIIVGEGVERPRLESLVQGPWVIRKGTAPWLSERYPAVSGDDGRVRSAVASRGHTHGASGSHGDEEAGRCHRCWRCARCAHRWHRWDHAAGEWRAV